MKSKKGYKLFQILKTCEEKGSLTNTEIRRIAYDITHGKGSFDKVKYEKRGYWSGFFSCVCVYAFTRPETIDTTPAMMYFNRLEKPLGYELNENGKDKLFELSKKFN